MSPTRRTGGSNFSTIHARDARQFRADLRKFGRARIRQTAIELSFQVLALALAADLAIVVGGKLFQVAISPAWLAILPVVGIVISSSTIWWRWPDQSWLASEIDRRLGLRERTITALELSSQHPAVAHAQAAGEPNAIHSKSSEERWHIDILTGAQLADAVAHLRQAEPVEVFSPRLPKVELIAIMVLVVVIAFAWSFEPASPPSPVETDLQRMALVEAERLDSFVEEMASQDTPSLVEQEAIREEIAQILREASEALKDQSENHDQTFARLSDLERRLATLQAPRSRDVAQTLARLADAFDRTPETRPVSAALDRREFALAAAELQRLGRDASGSDTHRQALGEALRQAAKETARHDQALAESLRQAVERLNSGENQSPTDEAADEIRRVGEMAETDEALQRALNQLQLSRRALAQGVSASVSVDGSQSASSDDASSTQGRAEGAGEGEGQGGSGNGSGTGTGQGEIGSETASGMRARQVQVPTGEFDNPSFSESEHTIEGEEGEITVDYRSVLPVYQERATRALQDRYVPHAMKDLVREYFSSLQSTR